MFITVFFGHFWLTIFSSVKTSVSWNKDRPQWLVGKDWIATLAERNRSLGRGQLCVFPMHGPWGWEGFEYQLYGLRYMAFFIHLFFFVNFSKGTKNSKSMLKSCLGGMEQTSCLEDDCWNPNFCLESKIFTYNLASHLVSGEFHVWPFQFWKLSFVSWSPTIDQQVTPESPTKHFRLLEDWLQIFNHFLGGKPFPQNCLTSLWELMYPWGL